MTRVREATPDDLEEILQVGLRNGLSSFNPDSVRESWQSHPFRAEYEGVPHGWVLEAADGRLVGTFSNVHMMYELDGQRLKAATAGSWAVDPNHRSASLFLAMSFFGQKGVDLLLNGSASAVASQIMPRLKAERIPSPGYDTSYFWIINSTAIARAALRKKSVPASGFLAPVAGAGISMWNWLRRLPVESGRGFRRLKSFGPEFDEFWEKVRRGPRRLRAVRTAAALRWRYGRSLQDGHAVLIAFGDGSTLDGYAVLLRRNREKLGLRQYLVGDLQALDDSPDLTRSLLAAALRVTREDGLDVLEWQGWNRRKRQVAEAFHPWKHNYGVWPLFYKVRNSLWTESLTGPEVWDFSPFDAF